MLNPLRLMTRPRKAPMDPIIAVIGATGTGKSKLAVDLALRFNGEIVNGDAMQMYKGLPIITNQIPVHERHGIPHHMLACIELDQPSWRITRFKREALKIIQEIRSRGKTPILVGGTHYYTQAVLFHKTILPSDQELDAASDDSAEEEKFPIPEASTEEMLQKLREVDPVMAERWHPNERRKIRRSLQIYLQTGRRASDIYEEQKVQMKKLRTETSSTIEENDDVLELERPADIGQIRFPTLTFWTHSDKEILRERLDKRVDDMLDSGLIPEAKTLFDYLKQKASEGVEVDRTRGVWVSIGFKELDPYVSALDSGNLGAEELAKLKEQCVSSIKTATRQYATTQLKWIKGQIWNAFRTAGVTDKLYVVDSSDPTVWDETVREPAERVTEAFVSGGTCPHPNDLSEKANVILTQRHEAAQKRDAEEIVNKKCEICGVKATTDAAWEKHIKNRRHKRRVKAAANWEKWQAYKKRLEEENEAKDGDASE